MSMNKDVMKMLQSEAGVWYDRRFWCVSCNECWACNSDADKYEVTELEYERTQQAISDMMWFIEHDEEDEPEEVVHIDLSNTFRLVPTK